MGWQVWPKVGDLDWVGHFVVDPALAHALVSKGIFWWTHMMDNNMLKPAHLIVGVMGVGVTSSEYGRIQAVVGSRLHMQSPVALASKTLREINKFLPLPNELHDLHFNHHTNTLTVFTDGSCANDHTAGAVYFGPWSGRNWAFSIATTPVSMVVELHSIEEALLSMPAGVNVCVATDSKASIEVISNWHAWKPGQRTKQEGRGTIERINALLSQFWASRRTVQFQHIYSHIDQKLRLVATKGEADKLCAKLQVLRNELWGLFEAWVKGNEGADRLATIGHSCPHASEPWTVPALGLAVTLFDECGHVVEGNIRCKVAVAGAKCWTDAMRQKLV
jgi:ribonuclease HI